ncbi:MAG: molybdenum cofactor guanylyltransferase [Ignavibacteriaceae bacterium]|nr:molybdenum cofactor guanylyltransferase [Ignavibacteriaceae bacterium]
MYNDITGFILAGGKSTRMGTNKSLLRIGGITIIERVVNLMKDLFKEVILITNQTDEFKFLNLSMYEDIHNDTGPLGGIHSALVNSTTEKNFIISCDMPLMTADVIKFLIEFPTKKPITIAKADNFIQQLCGVYYKNLVPYIEEIFKDSKTVKDETNPEQTKRGCSVLELIKNVPAEIIDIEKEYSGYQPGTYYNMNRPEEFSFIKDMLV